MMKLLIAMLIMSASFSSWSTVTAGAADCPVQFEGRVREVIEPHGSEDPLATNKVVIENRHTLKGDVEDKVIFDILQNGPFKIALDHEYRIQLRDGRLCWIEEI